MNETKHQLTKGDLKKMFWRSQFLMAANNYERMESLGAYFSIVPALKRIYQDASVEKKAAAIRRHLEFFNTNPYVYGAVLGITAAMEEQTTEAEKASVISVRTGLMGPLAGLGDSLLSMTIIPIFMSIGSGLAIQGNPLGPIVLFALFNVLIWTTKYKSLQLGYSQGSKMLTGVNGKTLLQRASTMGTVIGLMVVGSLIVSTVKLTVPIKYAVGKSTFKVQSMLDGIMPNLLPFLLTLLVYYLLKKKNAKNSVWIILAIMIGGIVLSYLGILG